MNKFPSKLKFRKTPDGREICTINVPTTISREEYELAQLMAKDLWGSAKHSNVIDALRTCYDFSPLYDYEDLKGSK